MGNTMTCRELTDFLDRYLFDELTAEQREAFDRHLAVCRHCRNYLASYQATIRLGKAALADASPDEKVPADVPQELVRAILAARAKN
jgi:anti-sigma factor RsiW